MSAATRQKRTSSSRRDVARRKAIWSEFNDAIRSAGHIEYFLECIKKREAEPPEKYPGAAGSRQWRLWKAEAVSRWGYHSLWRKGEPIVIPLDAPAPKFTPAQTAPGADKPIDDDPVFNANSDELPDIDFGADASFPEQVRWCQKALGVEPDQIPKRQIPSTGHLRMLKHANKDPDWFYKQVKALDAREESEKLKVKTFEDDQRRHFKLFDAILHDLERRKRKTAATNA